MFRFAALFIGALTLALTAASFADEQKGGTPNEASQAEIAKLRAQNAEMQRHLIESRDEVKTLKDFNQRLRDEVRERVETHGRLLTERDERIVQLTNRLSELHKKFNDLAIEIPGNAILVRTRDEKMSVAMTEASVRLLAGRSFVVGQSIKGDLARSDFGGKVVWIAADEIRQIVELPVKK